MKIAILSSIAWRTPPRNYGPWEQVTSILAEGLVAEGIDVTLFATADSQTRGRLVSVCEQPYAENAGINAKVSECLHISNLMEQADQFDIIHNHFDFLPLTYSRLINTPMITTIHGFSSPQIIPVYKKYNKSGHYISISNADRHPELDYLKTIYHGLNPNDFPFEDVKGNYLLYFGRIHPDKGTHVAIEIARLAGRPLKMAGLIQDQDYYNKKVKPFVDGEKIEYLGNVGPVERNSLLGGAKALLHPIFFDEPFGLSVVEAMMCGTPVIAFDRGSMNELIANGISGFIVRDIDSAVQAIEKLSQIDPHACRSHAVSHFSSKRMTEEYVIAYQKVLGYATT